MNTDHDHDGEGNCVPTEGYYNVQQPCWRFSFWDIAAISTSLAGALVGGTMAYVGSSLQQGANYIGREFQAAANFSRQTKDLEEAQRLNEAARRQMSEGLERLIQGDGS